MENGRIMPAEDVFDAYSPFIREFIYSRGWQSLHEVQLIAAQVIFGTDYNLLIPSSTASGKTEAAFFPILSQFYEDMPKSVGVIYIAPLKSLINDQFGRIDELLDMTGIPVYHWHGDVSASHKTKMLKNPSGVLQITPESLESMLMNRSNDIIRIFGDLRYVIIDEIHTLTGSDRGNQILCQLARLSRLIGHSPRRIGLSATIGDKQGAAAWLGSGSGRATFVPDLAPQKLKWRLAMEHFYIQNTDLDQSNDLPASFILPEDDDLLDQGAKKEDPTGDEKENTPPSLPPQAAVDAGYEYIYDCSKGKKSLVFSNSREETEYITATLRQIAEIRGEPDVFLIHHGFLSASIREEAELKMKDDEIQAVACATVTMELGIDIGKLERVLQLGSPNSVSSFLQRLGRSGRRDDPPEMMMVFREENPIPTAPLPQLIPWELLRAIAIVQLYIEERFIEPPAVRKLPFSLAFQQTLSTVAAAGALTAKDLADRVLTMPPFAEISKEDYKILLLSMLNADFLQMTEEKEIIVGLRGEKLISSFKFYAVFKDSDDYTVRCGSDEIGMISAPPPVGDRFALAGHVWEVKELDIPRKLIYVDRVKGKMEISWPGEYGEIHTKILERMRRVLMEDTEYPYLKPNALKRLRVARHVARNTGMLEKPIVHLGGYTWCLFPWLGTRSFRTLRRFIMRHGKDYKLSGMEYEGGNYMTFKLERGDGEDFMRYLGDLIAEEGIDVSLLIGDTELPVYEKYDDHIPGDLLRKAYCTDKLCSDEIESRAREFRRKQK